MIEKSEGPLPAAVMIPWLADNETYQQELQVRDSLLQDLSPIRARIETDPGIRMAEDVERVTGIDSQEMHMATAPMRVAVECEELAKASTPTIADTSYWSFLMEVNLAITQHTHNPGNVKSPLGH